MIPGLTTISKLPPWALIGFGVLAGYLKSVWNFIYTHTIGYLVNRISMTLSVEEVEHWDAYTWLSFWAEKRLRDRKITSLLLQRRQTIGDEDDTSSFGLIPHYGSYYMRWKGRPLTINHTKESSEGTPRPRRTMEIRLWFTFNREALLAVLESARREYQSENPNNLGYFTQDGYNDWSGAPLGDRPLDSLFLPEAMLHDILSDIKNWLAMEAAYRSLSLPYQRGFLLYGVAGSGKTTLVRAIASLLRLPVYSLAFNHESNVGKLRSLLKRCCGPCILLLEDADCIQVARSRDNEDTKIDMNQPDLNLSDLLNLIDGIGAPDKRLIIMTTNKPEMIDSALIRTGRIDRKWEFTYAADAEIRRFYERAKGPFKLSDWDTFRAGLPERCTMSDAQSFAVKGGA